MSSARLVLVGCCLLGMATSASAQGLTNCPPTLGVAEEKAADGKVFTAISAAELLVDDVDSRDLADEIARIDAMKLLGKHIEAPSEPSGALVGVIDAGSCVSDGKVYHAVTWSKALEAQALANMGVILSTSDVSEPSPEQHIPNLNFADDDFKRLLGGNVRNLIPDPSSLCPAGDNCKKIPPGAEPQMPSPGLQ